MSLRELQVEVVGNHYLHNELGFEWAVLVEPRSLSLLLCLWQLDVPHQISFESFVNYIKTTR